MKKIKRQPAGNQQRQSAPWERTPSSSVQATAQPGVKDAMVPGMEQRILPCYRLTFPNGLLLSRGRPDSYESPEALLRADTLKSALLACAVPLFPELREPAASKKWLGMFLLTSGFPFCGDELFFPKPLTRLPKFSQDGKTMKDEDAGKPMKKLRWLGQSYFEALLRADKTPWPTAHLLDGGVLISSTVRKVEEAEKLEARVSALHQQPHVFVPRGGGHDAVPYHTESLHFGPEAGLWFAAEYADATVQAQVEAALRLLADSGLGTDKNLGRGHFEWTLSELRLQVPPVDEARYCLNLAPWCPDLDANELTEGTLTGASYALSKRGGYLAAPAQEDLVRLRKRSVYMFDEGSVFPNAGPAPSGALHDLRPEAEAPEYFQIDHPVWRDGRPLWLPLLDRIPETIS